MDALAFEDLDALADEEFDDYCWEGSADENKKRKAFELMKWSKLLDDAVSGPIIESNPAPISNLPEQVDDIIVDNIIFKNLDLGLVVSLLQKISRDEIRLLKLISNVPIVLEKLANSLNKDHVIQFDENEKVVLNCIIWASLIPNDLKNKEAWKHAERIVLLSFHIIVVICEALGWGIPIIIKRPP